MSSSLLSSASGMPILEILNYSPLIYLISFNLFKCILPKGTFWSNLRNFQVRFKPSVIYKNAFRSSGSWYGEFSSSHLFIDISATPDLSKKEMSVTPIWFSRKPITFRDIVSKISLIVYFYIKWDYVALMKFQIRL